MKHSHHSIYSPIVIVMLLVLVVTGCATRKAFVSITRPAEINLKGIKRIAVDKINGNIGQRLADLITVALFKSDHFEVVDRENTDKIIKEYQLNIGGVIDENTAVQMGKVLGVSALICGNSSMDYKHSTWTKKEHDYEGYAYTVYYLKQIAKIDTVFRIVDLTTGKILVARMVTKEATNSDFSRNGWPQGMNKDILIKTALDKTVNSFMRIIAPYSYRIEIEFARSKSSEGKSGINFAKAGLWKDAIKQFESATKRTPNDSRAWYNLGLAYEYNNIFDKAIEAFKKSNELRPSYKNMLEIDNIKRMKSDKEKLKEQRVKE
jgi:tetratricopeptide (TPR) repeat protein